MTEILETRGDPSMSGEQKTCIHQFWMHGDPRCFSHCLDPDNCNPAAHGGVQVGAKCSKCGLEIALNANGDHVEGLEEGYSVLGWR